MCVFDDFYLLVFDCDLVAGSGNCFVEEIFDNGWIKIVNVK